MGRCICEVVLKPRTKAKKYSRVLTGGCFAPTINHLSYEKNTGETFFIND